MTVDNVDHVDNVDNVNNVNNVDNVDNVDDVDGHSNDKREFYHLLLSISITDEAKDQ